MISIAVDIGGTFTDVVAADSATGGYVTAKVPSTPARLVEAVAEGVLRVLGQMSAQPDAVDRFIHGTTVGTNAVLESKGAVTAVLATEGFEDVLEIGRLKRSRMYDVFMDAETPTSLAPRRRRRGVRERVAADGSVVTALDEERARATIRELVEEHGVRAFAVCLLFSFRNPAHERRLRELILELDSTLGVSLSSEVDPMFREYERTVVTTFDAYVRPVVERYVRELSTELISLGVGATVEIMQSRGGITSAERVTQRPVLILLSGPAAGVIGAKYAAARSGFSNLITIDIGGTSADISLVAEGKPLLSTEGRIDRFPLRVPMIDVNTIGAGGGSIAWTDASASFRVGPRSAGAEPGPVCYGRGGTEPTVTDASVVLGYLNPDYFAGGMMRLDAEAAHAALERFGERLGLSAVEAAAGIHRVVNSKMADEIRLVSVRRGYDPRQFALVLLGGAGPVHGGRLAAEMAIPTLVVPPVPGVLSALGLLVAKVEHDAAVTVALRDDEATPDLIETCYAPLEHQVAEMMAADRVPDGEAVTHRFADMRYVGQGYTLEVPVPAAIDAAGIAAVVDAFHATHRRIYAYSLPGAPVEFMNLRVVQEWGLAHPELNGSPVARTDEPTGSRLAYFEEAGGYVDTRVHQRDAIAVGEEIVGPAIVEQRDTTVVVYPGQQAILDAANNLLVAVPRMLEPAGGRGRRGDMSARAIDTISLEVIRNKLDDIADEMEITLLKSSHSTIVKEALDASAAIFDAHGQQIAQATASPIHLGMIIPAVRRFVELFPPETMRQGDVFVLNDPFDGGTHLPDLVITVPIVVAGETIALATAITHHQEMGGRSPGSTPMDATEIFQEGLRIPPLKLYDQGVPNETFFAMLERNVRIPEIVRGDIDGQLAACAAGVRGTTLLAARYGKDELHDYMAELLDRAEQMTREAIATIPDGTYRFVDFLDHDGIDLDRRVRIEVSITIDDSEFIVDMTGTDPQVRGPINCVPASTLSAIYYVVKIVTDPLIPNNAGCYRPVTAILPEGSVVNAHPPAACNARALVVRRTVDAMLGALAPVLPDRVPAASNGHPLVMSMGGVDTATGRPFVTAEVGTGGMGGRPGMDGIDAVQTDTSNAQNVPVEALELEYPLRVGYYRLRQDSGGAGAFRGGLGLEKSIQVLRGEVRFSHRGERHHTAPWGLFGGEAGTTSESRLMRADGIEESMPSKAELVLRAGDELHLRTTGGGGHGDPLERAPAAVLADVLDGKVSQQAASARYGVVIVRGSVDDEATRRRRTELTGVRGPVSWTYDRGPLGRE